MIFFLHIILATVLAIVCFLAITVMFMMLQSVFMGTPPYVPVRTGALDLIVETLQLRQGSVLYDLGSGDGKVLVHAARKHPDISVVGIERSYLPRYFSKANAVMRGVADRSMFKGGSFLDADVSKATHMYLYLLPHTMLELEEKLERELKPGTRVVSCDFRFPGRHSERVIPIPGNHRFGRNLYVYVF